MLALKIGVTGNIGSGKTTICKLFESIGIPVYYSDDRAKYLMNTDTSLIKQIKYLLGPEAYDQGSLNRPHIAKIVFNNKKILSHLNELVHPAVQKDSRLWFEQQVSLYAITEAALLIESGSYKSLDKLIVIVANRENRINRVIKRDHVSRESVETRMDNQLSQADKISKADYIIENDNKESLIKQIWVIHRNIVEYQINER